MITHHMWIATWHASMYKAAPWLNILPLSTFYVCCRSWATMTSWIQIWRCSLSCCLREYMLFVLNWQCFFFFHQVKQSWFLVHSMKSGQEAESGALNTPAWADKPMHYFLLNSSSCKFFSFLAFLFSFMAWVACVRSLHFVSIKERMCTLCNFCSLKKTKLPSGCHVHSTSFFFFLVQKQSRCIQRHFLRSVLRMHCFCFPV